MKKNEALLFSVTALLLGLVLIFLMCFALAQLRQDINNDSSVDINDLISVLHSYGLKSTDPGFNASLDIVHDSRIDLLDIVAIARGRPAALRFQRL